MTNKVYLIKENDAKIQSSEEILEVDFDQVNDEIIVVRNNMIQYYSSINGDLK